MRGCRGPSLGVRRAFAALSLLGLAVGLLPGCGDEAPAPAPAVPSFSGVSLTVGVLGDDTAILSGISAQRGEWVATRGGEITIREEPIRAVDAVPSVDLIIFPAQELGNLIDADTLETIPNDAVMPPQPLKKEVQDQDEPVRTEESPAESFRYTDLASVFREQVTKYGTDRMALPLGGSALVLVYRRDAFTRDANRESARAAGLALEPPATWTQLDALARFFQGRDWNGDGAPDHGLAVALGADPEGVANAVFLARAASLGQHRDQFSFLFDADSMAPRITSPPFIEALRGVIAWKKSGPPGIDRFDAEGARKAFREGHVAMLIDRAERAVTWSHGKPLGVAPLPGSERVFEPVRKVWETSLSPPNTPSYLPRGGGWLIGVKHGLSGSQREAAVDLARYLANPENANRLRAERTFPMLPFRASQIGQGLPDPTSAPDVDPRQWSDAVSRTLMAARVVPGLRIPEAGGYLEDLAKERIAAVAGKDPEAALNDVSAAWTSRTRALGTQRQLWHYRRSLNSLATLPQPPARGK